MRPDLCSALITANLSDPLCFNGPPIGEECHESWIRVCVHLCMQLSHFVQVTVTSVLPFSFIDFFFLNLCKSLEFLLWNPPPAPVSPLRLEKLVDAQSIHLSSVKRFGFGKIPYLLCRLRAPHVMWFVFWICINDSLRNCRLNKDLCFAVVRRQT